MTKDKENSTTQPAESTRGEAGKRPIDTPSPIAPPDGDGAQDVVVSGRPVASTKAADDRPRVVGAPEYAPLEGRVEGPPVSEAQLAAGPHRPEPARQVRHDPGYVPVQEPRAGEPNAPKNARIKVRATRDGFYAEARRRVGDVFEITDDKHFSKTWMELVPAGTQERATTGQDVIDREHDRILEGRSRGGGRAASKSPLEDA